MRTSLAGLLVVGSLAILTGCGGSSNSTLSYSAFSNAANQICTNVNAQTKAVGGGASDTANAANAAAIDKVLAISDRGIAKIKALSGPSALIAARNTFVTDVNENAVVAKQAATAARAGNQSAFDAAAKQLTAEDSHTSDDASKLGATACATS